MLPAILAGFRGRRSASVRRPALGGTRASVTANLAMSSTHAQIREVFLTAPMATRAWRAAAAFSDSGASFNHDPERISIRTLDSFEYQLTDGEARCPRSNCRP